MSQKQCSNVHVSARHHAMLGRVATADRSSARKILTNYTREFLADPNVKYVDPPTADDKAGRKIVSMLSDVHHALKVMSDEKGMTLFDLCHQIVETKVKPRYEYLVKVGAISRLD